MPETDCEKSLDIQIAAPAKINLALSVGPAVTDGPRRGYHPIASWFVCVSLCDHVRIRGLQPTEPSRYAIAWASDAPRTSPIDWPIEKDLAVRAHRLLEQYVGRSLPIEMIVSKRIPVGGGLGGGSSDAAAALIGLQQLFGLGISFDELHGLSTGLGADVAFFLDEQIKLGSHLPRPALVTGFGERIERLARTLNARAVLIFPDGSCPTGPVYQAFDRGPVQNVRESDVRRLIDRAAGEGMIDSAGLFNDLAAPACEVQPRLGEALRKLLATLAPLPVHVTGSGSTMFVLVPRSDSGSGPSASEDHAEIVRRQIGEALPGIQSIVVELT